MSISNLYNSINNNKLKDIKIVTSSVLSVLDNTIEFEVNGTPSNIVINYSGTGRFFKEIPINIKTKIGKTLILITNVFKQDIPRVLFEYSGDITIYSCQVMNFDGSKVQAIINNNQNEQLINKQRTNLEDDTLILYDTQKIEVKRPFKSGLVKPMIQESSINKFGKVQKYGKKEIEIVTKTVKERVPIRKESSKFKPIKKLREPVEKMIKPKRERVVKEPRKQTNTIKYEGGK